MSKVDMKKFELDTKENFIIYLRRLIQNTQSEIRTLKRYLKELELLIIDREYDKNPKKIINPNLYIDINNKIGMVTNQLLNLIGDHTNLAISYKKFRFIAQKRMEKGLDLYLEPLSDEILDILSQLNEARNWSLHVPESLLTAEMEMINILLNDNSDKLFPAPFNPIYVTQFDNYEAEWLNDLLKQTKHMNIAFSKVFQQMKMDYSKLIGEYVRVLNKEGGTRTIHELNLPLISYDIQRRKYSGIENYDIQLP